jgi:hypothetical protein
VYNTVSIILRGNFGSYFPRGTKVWWLDHTEVRPKGRDLGHQQQNLPQICIATPVSNLLQSGLRLAPHSFGEYGRVLHEIFSKESAVSIPSLSSLELAVRPIAIIVATLLLFPRQQVSDPVTVQHDKICSPPWYEAIPFLNISEPRLFERVRTIPFSIFSEPRLYSGSKPFLFRFFLSQDILMSAIILSSFNPTIIPNSNNLCHRVVKNMGLDSFVYDSLTL